MIGTGDCEMRMIGCWLSAAFDRNSTVEDLRDH